MRLDRGDTDDEDEIDEEADDLPGLYYPMEYVLQTWQEKRNNGILPDPGGLNDQDWRLVYHDWPIINAIYNRLMVDGASDHRPLKLPVTDQGIGEMFNE